MQYYISQEQLVANIPNELVPETAAIPATSAPSTDLNYCYKL